MTGTEYVHSALDVGVWIDGNGRIMDKLSDNKPGFREKFTGKEGSEDNQGDLEVRSVGVIVPSLGKNLAFEDGSKR